MEEKKGNGSVFIIGIMLLIILCLSGYVLYDKLYIEKDNSINDTVNNNVNNNNNNDIDSNDINSNKDSNSKTDELSGQFYLLDGDGLVRKRRYYLAFDDPTLMGTDNTFLDYRNKKVYLMDLNLSSENKLMREIDFSNLIKDVYNQKINSLPDVLAKGTVNEIKSSQCKKFKISYVDGTALTTIDGSKEVPFGIYYSCIHDYQGGEGELSLGTNYYVLDVPSMKVISK